MLLIFICFILCPLSPQPSVNIIEASYLHFTQPSLHFAAQKGSNSQIELLIKQGVCVDLLDSFNRTPLYYATQNFLPQTVQLLLRYGASLDTTHPSSQGYLHTALYHHSESMALLFIQHQHNLLNQVNCNGDLPLHIACKEGLFDFINSFLLNDLSHLDVMNKQGNTPLHVATQEGQLLVVQQLLLKKANIYLKNKNGDTPLHIACREGYLQIMRLFLLNKADTLSANNDANTPLHIACQYGNTSIVEELLLHPFDIHLKNKNGDTPLHITCQEGDLRIMQLLLLNKVDIFSSNNDGNTPLHIACQSNCYHTLSFLIHHILNLHKQFEAQLAITPSYEPSFPPLKAFDLANHSGQTPFDIACSNKDIGYLILFPPSVFQNNGLPYHSTFLHLACQYGNLTVVHHLIKKSRTYPPIPIPFYVLHKHPTVHFSLLTSVSLEPCVNLYSLDSCKNTPLHIACRYGHNLIVEKLLLEYSYLLTLYERRLLAYPQPYSDINAVNQSGNTALHLACQYGHASIVLQLILSNAKLNLINKRGSTPLSIAHKNKFQDIQLMLIQHNAHIHKTSYLRSVFTLSSFHTLFFDNPLSSRYFIIHEQDTALHVSIRNRLYHIVSLIIDTQPHALVEKNTKHNQALHVACQINSFTLVCRLIQHHPPINVANAKGHTPLHISTQNKSFNIVRLLIQNKAQLNTINTKGNTPLHIATLNQSFDIALLLVQNNASLDIINNKGLKPLDNLPYLQKILQETSIHSIPITQGDTALHTCARLSLDQLAQVILKDPSVNINAQNFFGETPLHIAIQQPNSSILRTLILNNADVNLINHQNKPALNLREILNFMKNPVHVPFLSLDPTDTLLHYAVRYQLYSIAQLLLTQCLPQNLRHINSQEGTPLHIACFIQSYKFVQLLLSYSTCAIYLQNKDGDTPLHIACQQRHFQIAFYLIQKGAPIYIQNHQKDTPLSSLFALRMCCALPEQDTPSHIQPFMPFSLSQAYPEEAPIFSLRHTLKSTHHDEALFFEDKYIMDNQLFSQNLTVPLFLYSQPFYGPTYCPSFKKVPTFDPTLLSSPLFQNETVDDFSYPQKLLSPSITSFRQPLLLRVTLPHLSPVHTSTFT